MHQIIFFSSRPAKRIHKQLHTSVSASKKTHLEYCVSRQQCNFVNVTPSSGRDSNSRLTASSLSRTLTVVTRSKTDSILSLHSQTTPLSFKLHHQYTLTKTTKQTFHEHSSCLNCTNYYTNI